MRPSLVDCMVHWSIMLFFASSKMLMKWVEQLEQLRPSGLGNSLAQGSNIGPYSYI